MALSVKASFSANPNPYHITSLFQTSEGKVRLQLQSEIRMKGAMDALGADEL